MRRIAIIMAGGSGERFWPVSQRDHPKQLLSLTGSGRTMLEEAVDRISPIVGIENVFIATAPHLLEALRGSSAGVPQDNVFAEPHKKNTAGALVWAEYELGRRFPGECLSIAVVTADHQISPKEAFSETVTRAFSTAEVEEGLVTIGIKPDRPETGYGYIEVGEHIGLAHRVKSFREKPDLERAKEYVAVGNFFWNSGMFFWTSNTFNQELKAASPGHFQFLEAATGKDIPSATELFEQLPNISIDYALMEQSKKVYVVKALFDWDDLGAWDALERVRPHDASGNVVEGRAYTLDSHGSIILNQSTTHDIFGLGLENLIVVVTDATIMICPKDRAQEVRKLGSLSEETKLQ